MTHLLEIAKAKIRRNTIKKCEANILVEKKFEVL